jgi:hypothetical protein
MFQQASLTSLIAKLSAPPHPGARKSRGRTLLSRRPDDGQNRGTTPGSLKMSANVPASSAACPKPAPPARMPHRLAFAVSLTILLSGTAASAGGEDGPMASAPLPPPLPAAQPATQLQQPQEEPSPTSRRVLPQARRPIGSSMQSAHRHKPNKDPHHIDHSARAARGQKRLGQREAGDAEYRETYTDPRVASALIPPPAPLPFSYRYIPGAPPAYGYAPVYPPSWPPGPVFPR